MLDIHEEYSFEEQRIVRSFPQDGIEFNGQSYLECKKVYNRLLSCGILFVADRRIGYANPFIHLSLAGQILQQYIIMENKFDREWDMLQKDIHKVASKQVAILLKDLIDEFEVE